jgi:protein PhnA
MTKNVERGHRHHHDLSSLGKDLTRRSHARCELCDVKGVPLQAYEVPPIPDELDINDTLFLCDTCFDQILHPEKLEPAHWHCLHHRIWSDMPALQVTAVRVLKNLAPLATWATQLLEELYLDPDIANWVNHEDC